MIGRRVATLVLLRVYLVGGLASVHCGDAPGEREVPVLSQCKACKIMQTELPQVPHRYLEYHIPRQWLPFSAKHPVLHVSVRLLNLNTVAAEEALSVRQKRRDEGGDRGLTFDRFKNGVAVRRVTFPITNYRRF